MNLLPEPVYRTELSRSTPGRILLRQESKPGQNPERNREENSGINYGRNLCLRSTSNSGRNTVSAEKQARAKPGKKPQSTQEKEYQGGNYCFGGKTDSEKTPGKTPEKIKGETRGKNSRK